jgi:hypothetical protein
LYNLVEDPEESYDCAGDNAELVETIFKEVEKTLPSFPAEVGNSWADTKARRTGWTFPGAYPYPYRAVRP